MTALFIALVGAITGGFCGSTIARITLPYSMDRKQRIRLSILVIIILVLHTINLILI